MQLLRLVAVVTAWQTELAPGGCAPLVTGTEAASSRLIPAALTWLRERVPLAMLMASAKASPAPRDFIGAIKAATERTGKPGLIAEVRGGGQQGIAGVRSGVNGVVVVVYVRGEGVEGGVLCVCVCAVVGGGGAWGTAGVCSQRTRGRSSMGCSGCALGTALW